MCLCCRSDALFRHTFFIPAAGSQSTGLPAYRNSLVSVPPVQGLAKTREFRPFLLSLSCAVPHLSTLLIEQCVCSASLLTITLVAGLPQASRLLQVEHRVRDRNKAHAVRPCLRMAASWRLHRATTTRALFGCKSSLYEAAHEKVAQRHRPTLIR
jgi:hypothetical protein